MTVDRAKAEQLARRLVDALVAIGAAAGDGGDDDRGDFVGAVVEEAIDMLGGAGIDDAEYVIEELDYILGVVAGTVDVELDDPIWKGPGEQLASEVEDHLGRLSPPTSGD